jgi:hypothetical protein
LHIRELGAFDHYYFPDHEVTNADCGAYGEGLFPAIPIAFPALTHLIISSNPELPMKEGIVLGKFTEDSDVNHLMETIEDPRFQCHPLRIFKLCFEALIKRLGREAMGGRHTIRTLTYNARIYTNSHELDPSDITGKSWLNEAHITVSTARCTL